MKEPHVVGGYLWRADVDATGDPGVAGERTMVVEALDEAPLRAFAAERLRPGAFREAGVDRPPTLGYYRLISFMEAPAR